MYSSGSLLQSRRPLLSSAAVLPKAGSSSLAFVIRFVNQFVSESEPALGSTTAEDRRGAERSGADSSPHGSPHYLADVDEFSLINT